MTENVEELVEILEQTEIDTNSIRYVRKMKGISTTNKENNPSSGWGGRLGGLANAVSQVFLYSKDMNSKLMLITPNLVYKFASHCENWCNLYFFVLYCQF